MDDIGLERNEYCKGDYRGKVRDSGSRLNGGCTRKVPRQWLHEGGTTMVARGGTVVV